MDLGSPFKSRDPDEVQMSFGDHLEELRRRLIYCLAGVAVSGAVTFYYGMQITAWLYTPLAHAQRNAGVPIETMTLTAMSGFTVYIKVSLIAALVVAAPWLLYQIWQFVAVGLYRSERRVVVLLAPFSAIMTALGVAFAYYILLPVMLTFLIGFATRYPQVAAGEATWLDAFANWTSTIGVPGAPGPAPAPGPGPGPGGGGGESETLAPSTQALTEAQTAVEVTRIEVLEGDPAAPVEGQWWLNRTQQDVRVWLGGRVLRAPLSIPAQNQPRIELSDHIDFVLYLILAVVIAFQLPVVMLIAGWSGLVDPRWVAGVRKYAFFACAVAGALISPTGDPFNMLLMALPLYLLFEFGLVLMRLVYRRPAPEADAEEG
ncbi:MAG: twin-arginine translocase subunit TatC [Phycisphaeraceae bacterium]